MKKNIIIFIIIASVVLSAVLTPFAQPAYAVAVIPMGKIQNNLLN